TRSAASRAYGSPSAASPSAWPPVTDGCIPTHAHARNSDGTPAPSMRDSPNTWIGSERNGNDAERRRRSIPGGRLRYEGQNDAHGAPTTRLSRRTEHDMTWTPVALGDGLAQLVWECFSDFIETAPTTP